MKHKKLSKFLLPDTSAEALLLKNERKKSRTKKTAVAPFFHSLLLLL